MTTDSKKLFISHATVEDALVNTIADKIIPAHKNISLWIDHRLGLTPETPDWETALRVAIENCDAGILVMTKASLTSKICKAECLLVQNFKKPLYVIRAEAVDFKEIWLNISLIQYADYVTDADKAITDLMRAISGGTGDNLPTPSTKKFTDAGNIHDKLPYLQNPMRGREALLAEVTADVNTGHITQIIGTGGLGKSRLAAEIALNDPHGAVWFRSDVTNSIADLNNALRKHADLPTDADLSVAIGRVQSQNALVVVDNAEAVTDTQRPAYVSLIQDLRGRGIRVLMTTRKTWHDLKASKIHNIGGVDGPDGEQIAHDFATSESLALTHAQIKELARESRYYPRLMEFSITQLREFEVEVILKRLKKLRYDSHKDWQDALNEMITLTVDQMKTEKRGQFADALLRRLTWLSAPCEKAVILALKPSDMDEDDVDDALALIRRYQFIRYDDQTKRYQVAELVREALGTDETAFPIFADWYIGRARAIFHDLADNPELWGDGLGGANFDDVENIRGLGADLVHLTQNGTQGDSERALEFAVMTRRYVTNRMEARAWEWLEMGLNAVRILRRDKVGDADLLDSEALMLNELGLIKGNLGYPHEALRYYEDGLALRRQQGNQRGEATMLNNIAGVYYALGDIQKALAYYEQTLSIYRAVGDRGGEATALNNIGMVYRALGDNQKALAYYEQALSLYRAVGDRGGEATTLNNIAGVYYALGDIQKALAYLEQVLPIDRAVGDRGGEATTLNNIGMVYDDLGDKHKALTYYEQALPMHRTVGNRQMEATTLNNIGAVYADLGDKQKALDYYEQALPILQSVGDRRGESVTLNNIGAVYRTLGDNQKALAYYEQVLPIFRAVGDKRGEAVTCFNMGMVYEDLGDLDKAIAFVERCVILDEQIRHPDLESDRQYLMRLKRKRGVR